MAKSIVDSEVVLIWPMLKPNDHTDLSDQTDLTHCDSVIDYVVFSIS